MSSQDFASQSLVVSPNNIPRTVLHNGNMVLNVPVDWELLPPGDAGLTRRVKSAVPTWTVQVKKGRKTFSQGLWACSRTIAQKKAELELERAQPAYEKKQLYNRERRERKQADYVENFEDAVVIYLDFAENHEPVARKLARAVTVHATPVGSGTVARTERIPIEQRAESAVIAWMRHQTTAYDNMKIARVKGERREVRRMLAQRSKDLLEQYRAGRNVDQMTCPLYIALSKLNESGIDE